MQRRAGNTRKGGRRSALGEARELFILWGALSQDGETVDAGIVAQRMGITQQAAQVLLDLVISAKGNDDDFLSLYYADNDQQKVAVSPDGSNRGQIVRLTKPEYIALVAALNTLGLPVSDPLRSKIRSLKPYEAMTDEDVIRRFRSAGTSPAYPWVFTCGQALVDHCALRFVYQGSADSRPHDRETLPQALELRDGTWMLVAFDYKRAGIRNFRVDRMSNLELIPAREAPGLDPQSRQLGDSQTSVCLRFEDSHYLDLFDWPGLVLDGGKAGSITGVIPYYSNSSDWLVHRLAACDGHVTTNDPALNQRITDYVCSLKKLRSNLIAP